ncbi:MAG: hypothetical protein QXH92_03800 [Candidatus Aenigmatarchaeota archaeon]
MITLDALVQRYDEFYIPPLLNDFVEYCRKNEEPCSVAGIDYHVVDENEQIIYAFLSLKLYN